MAGIEASISSIIASKCSLYLLLKLALKWVFEKHFSVIIPIFFFSGREVDRSLCFKFCKNPEKIPKEESTSGAL